MISNGHQIDEIRKDHFAIDRILNKNKKVFEAPHAIYPDIRLEYIANGPDELSSTMPDVYFQLPSTSYASGIELDFSIANVSNQGILGNLAPFGNDGVMVDFPKINGRYLLSCYGSSLAIDSYKPSKDNRIIIEKNGFVHTEYWDFSKHYLWYFSGHTTYDSTPADASSSDYTPGDVYNKETYLVGSPVISNNDSSVLTPGRHRYFCYDNGGNPGTSGIYIFRETTSGYFPEVLSPDLIPSAQRDTRSFSGLKIHSIKLFKLVDKRYSGVSSIRELSAYFIPVLHWDGTQYKPCFYDKISGKYSTYNLGTDEPVYLQTNDKILDYIGNGSYAGRSTTNDIYFNTDTYLVYSSSTLSSYTGNTYKATYEFEFSTVKPNKGTITKNTIFGCPSYTGNASDSRFYVSTTGAGIVVNYHNASTDDVGLISLRGSIDDFKKHHIIVGTNPLTATGQSTIYRYAVYDSSSDIVGGDELSYPYKAKIYPMVLFAYTDQNGIAQPTPGGHKIHYFNVSHKQAASDSYGKRLGLFASLIPVLHNGVPCFYDMLRNYYIYNSGSETPTYELVGVEASSALPNDSENNVSYIDVSTNVDLFFNNSSYSSSNHRYTLNSPIYFRRIRWEDNGYDGELYTNVVVQTDSGTYNINTATLMITGSISMKSISSRGGSYYYLDFAKYFGRHPRIIAFQGANYPSGIQRYNYAFSNMRKQEWLLITGDA